MLPAAIRFPDLSPELLSVSLFGLEFALRWYALAYIAGIVFGWWAIARMLRRPALWGDKPPMTAAQAESLLTWIVLGIILGGRLGYVFFYRWDHYRDNMGEIFQIWQGGMAFHGGFLGVIAGVLVFSALNRIGPGRMVRVGDAIAAVAPVGLLFGRLANFVNAELWGRPTNLPWGVVFPSAEAQVCAQEYGEICARPPSQLYEAALEGLVLGLVMWWGVRRRLWLAVPGRTIGVFLLGYGLARVLVEGFRQADPQFITDANPWGHVWRLGESAGAWGLTMGQVLSLPMIAGGIVVLLIARRRA